MLDKESRAAVSGYSEGVGKFFGRLCTPNQMTLITLILGLTAAILVFYGRFLMALLFFFGSGLSDWVDGAIARETKRVTDFGGAFDSMVDKVTELALYFALALWDTSLALPALFASTGMLWSSYVNQRCKAIGLGKGKGFMQRKERAFLLVMTLLALDFAMEGLGVAVFILLAIGTLSFLTGIQRAYLAYRRKK